MRFKDKLPTTVTIDGVEHPIYWDFHAAISFELVLEEETDDFKIVLQCLEIFYGDNIPSNMGEAVNKALEFYAGGKQENTKNTDARSVKPYSFDVDWDYLYAAFLEQYGIDLHEKILHWWKFRAMFQSLNEDTKFGEIVGYRTVKLSSKMSKEQRDFYRKMKRDYALPKMNGKERKRVEEIRTRLKNGESIEDILDNQGSDED